MKDEIINHLNAPGQLEKMYRSNKLTFRREFGILYQELKGNPAADFWNERLNYKTDEIHKSNGRELLFVIIASLTAGLIAKLPVFLALNEESFYQRNIGFIIFPALSAYFAWKNKLSTGKIAFIIAATIAAIVFINFLPQVKKSDTLILSCIHLVLFLWAILGFTFVAGHRDNDERRLGYLRYNGDLVVMTTLILIASGLMTAITIGLFSLIGFNIENFYFENIGIFGLAAAPIAGTYLVQTNPQLVGKVSPVIARLFSPLVLVMLVIYLLAIVYSGKNPYTDREFLLIFNALLIGVMAIIFFSIAETAKKTNNSMEVWVLFLLSIVTIVLNSIALSAILFRISEWGITPNRAAVMGGNILILINLILVTVKLSGLLSKKSDITGVGKVIASYLPVYFAWTIIVTFVFPFIFGYK